METPTKVGVRGRSGVRVQDLVWTEFLLTDPDGSMTSIWFNNVDDRTLDQVQASLRLVSVDPFFRQMLKAHLS